MRDQSITKTVSEDGTTAMVSVSGALTIETGGEFHRVLADAFNGSQRVALDMRQLETIDVTALQVICSACKTAAEQQCRFECASDLPACLVTLGISIGMSRVLPCNQNAKESCIWFGGGK